MLNKLEPELDFSATKHSQLMAVGDKDTQSVLLTSSLLHWFVMITVTAENPASNR